MRHTCFPGTDPHHHGYERVTGADGTARLVDVMDWNQAANRAAGDIISTTADPVAQRIARATVKQQPERQAAR